MGKHLASTLTKLNKNDSLNAVNVSLQKGMKTFVDQSTKAKLIDQERMPDNSILQKTVASMFDHNPDA